MQQLPSSLPPKELPFTLEIEGSVTGKKYSGNFIVTVPKVQDMGRIGVEIAKLTGGIPLHQLPQETAILFNAVAYLKVLLIMAPDWFVQSGELDYGMNTLDPNIVIEVFNSAREKVDGWYLLIRPKAPEEEKVN